MFNFILKTQTMGEFFRKWSETPYQHRWQALPPGPQIGKELHRRVAIGLQDDASPPVITRSDSDLSQLKMLALQIMQQEKIGKKSHLQFRAKVAILVIATTFQVAAVSILLVKIDGGIVLVDVDRLLEAGPGTEQEPEQTTAGGFWPRESVGMVTEGIALGVVLARRRKIVRREVSTRAHRLHPHLPNLHKKSKNKPTTTQDQHYTLPQTKKITTNPHRGSCAKILVTHLKLTNNKLLPLNPEMQFLKFSKTVVTSDSTSANKAFAAQTTAHLQNHVNHARQQLQAMTLTPLRHPSPEREYRLPLPPPLSLS
jgi:hypothetical protein